MAEIKGTDPGVLIYAVERMHIFKKQGKVRKKPEAVRIFGVRRLATSLPAIINDSSANC